MSNTFVLADMLSRSLVFLTLRATVLKSIPCDPNKLLSPLKFSIVPAKHFKEAKRESFDPKCDDLTKKFYQFIVLISFVLQHVVLVGKNVCGESKFKYRFSSIHYDNKFTSW